MSCSGSVGLIEDDKEIPIGCIMLSRLSFMNIKSNKNFLESYNKILYSVVILVKAPGCATLWNCCDAKKISNVAVQKYLIQRMNVKKVIFH